MTLNLSKITSAVIVSAALWIVLATPVQAQTQAWSGVCVASDPEFSDVATIQGLQCLIANLLSVVIALVGLSGFVMTVIASLRYMASGSNSKGADLARGTATSVVIGLLIALSAYILLNLIAAFTGVSIIKTFVIPDSNTGL